MLNEEDLTLFKSLLEEDIERLTYNAEVDMALADIRAYKNVCFCLGKFDAMDDYKDYEEEHEGEEEC